MRERFDDQLAALDRQAERWENAAPVCSCCGYQMQGDYYFEIDDEILCEDCVVDKYRRDVDNYRSEHLYD